MLLGNAWIYRSPHHIKKKHIYLLSIGHDGSTRQACVYIYECPVPIEFYVLLPKYWPTKQLGRGSPRYNRTGTSCQKEKIRRGIPPSLTCNEAQHADLVIRRRIKRQATKQEEQEEASQKRFRPQWRTRTLRADVAMME